MKYSINFSASDPRAKRQKHLNPATGNRTMKVEPSPLTPEQRGDGLLAIHAWIPALVELRGHYRLNAETISADVHIILPGHLPHQANVHIRLAGSPDSELVLMAAVSHLQADFRAPGPSKINL